MVAEGRTREDGRVWKWGESCERGTVDRGLTGTGLSDRAEKTRSIVPVPGGLRRERLDGKGSLRLARPARQISMFVTPPLPSAPSNAIQPSIHHYTSTITNLPLPSPGFHAYFEKEVRSQLQQRHHLTDMTFYPDRQRLSTSAPPSPEAPGRNVCPEHARKGPLKLSACALTDNPQPSAQPDPGGQETHLRCASAPDHTVRAAAAAQERCRGERRRINMCGAANALPPNREKSRRGRWREIRRPEGETRNRRIGGLLLCPVPRLIRRKMIEPPAFPEPHRPKRANPEVSPPSFFPFFPPQWSGKPLIPYI